MSRSSIPSPAQLDMLLECLENQRWLATGHARTADARQKMKVSWAEIATKLNSDGRGCIKTPQQWAKYWKDKKSAVKKKCSQIRLARQKTGGGVAEEINVLSIEDRIKAVTGGEQFAIDDREIEINPFHPTIYEAIPAVPMRMTDFTASESILQVYVETMTVEPATAIEATESIELVTGVKEQQVTKHTVPESGPTTENTEAPAPAPPALASLFPNSTTSSPRRRRLTGRRRLVRRSPPSQRQSQMVSLTERFITIEEQRVETERVLAQRQRDMINVLREMSRAWSR